MPEFKLVSDFQPTGDQPQAIERLVEGLNKEHQTQLVAIGGGKSLNGEGLYVSNGHTD
jgi:excinuclease ABC subunit B